MKSLSGCGVFLAWMSCLNPAAPAADPAVTNAAATNAAETVSAVTENAAAPKLPARGAARATTPRIVRTMGEGDLTPANIAQIRVQHNELVANGQFRAQEKLSAEDYTQLRQRLHSASQTIFCPQQLPNGGMVQFLQYDVNVKTTDDVTRKLEADTMTPPEARALVKDYARMLQLLTALASADARGPARTAHLRELNTMINKYFVMVSKTGKR